MWFCDCALKVPTAKSMYVILQLIKWPFFRMLKNLLCFTKKFHLGFLLECESMFTLNIRKTSRVFRSSTQCWIWRVVESVCLWLLMVVYACTCIPICLQSLKGRNVKLTKLCKDWFSALGKPTKTCLCRKR